MMHNKTYRLLLVASHVQDYETKKRLVRVAYTVKEAGIADMAQLGLDALGFIPALGEIADGINALVSIARGDYFGAAASAISMIPEAGDVVGKGGKLLRWLLKLAAKPGKLGKVAKFIAENGKMIKTTLTAFVKFVETNADTIMSYLRGFQGLVSGEIGDDAPDPIKALAKSNQAKSLLKKAGPGVNKMVGTATYMVKSAPKAMKMFEIMESKAAQELKMAA